MPTKKQKELYNSQQHLSLDDALELFEPALPAKRYIISTGSFTGEDWTGQGMQLDHVHGDVGLRDDSTDQFVYDKGLPLARTVGQWDCLRLLHDTGGMTWDQAVERYELAVAVCGDVRLHTLMLVDRDTAAGRKRVLAYLLALAETTGLVEATQAPSTDADADAVDDVVEDVLHRAISLGGMFTPESPQGVDLLRAWGAFKQRDTLTKEELLVWAANILHTNWTREVDKVKAKAKGAATAAVFEEKRAIKREMEALAKQVVSQEPAIDYTGGRTYHGGFTYIGSLSGQLWRSQVPMLYGVLTAPKRLETTPAVSGNLGSTHSTLEEVWGALHKVARQTTLTKRSARKLWFMQTTNGVTVHTPYSAFDAWGDVPGHVIDGSVLALLQERDSSSDPLAGLYLQRTPDGGFRVWQANLGNGAHKDHTARWCGTSSRLSQLYHKFSIGGVGTGGLARLLSRDFAKKTPSQNVCGSTAGVHKTANADETRLSMYTQVVSTKDGLHHVYGNGHVGGDRLSQVFLAAWDIYYGITLAPTFNMKHSALGSTVLWPTYALANNFETVSPHHLREVSQLQLPEDNLSRHHVSYIEDASVPVSKLKGHDGTWERAKGLMTHTTLALWLAAGVEVDAPPTQPPGSTPFHG